MSEAKHQEGAAEPAMNAVLLRAAFDAMPALIFIVDEDVRIVDYNEAAAAILSVRRPTALNRRGGELLHCLHASDVPEGCGRAPFCKDCIIRNAVNDAFDGKKTVRRRAHMELLHRRKKTPLYALITATPVSFEGRSLAVLVIEDISELAELQRLIPICSVCGKIRDDKASWLRVEQYFHKHWDVDFSHSLCPDCYRSEMAKL